MIYLIKSSGFSEKNGEIKFFSLLKIGYTNDNNKNKRYDQYKLHNPTISVIHEIPNGTEEQESKLHYKFKNKKFNGYGNEWFYYDEEIVDYVKSVTLEELNKLPNNPVRGDRKVLNGKREAKKIISYLFNTKEEINNYLSTLADKLGDTISYTTAIDYISQDSTIDKDKLKNYYEIKRRSDTGIYTENRELNLEVSSFMRTYESLTTIHDKLQILCEYDLSSDAKSIILAQIPDSDIVKSYYKALGPTKIKSSGYNITDLNKLMGEELFDKSILISAIYSEFNVDDKLPSSEIKERLSKIYSRIGYTKSPKATDLKEYFETKDIQTSEIINGKRKNIRGYRLTKRLK